MPFNTVGTPCPNCGSLITRVVNTTRSTDGQMVLPSAWISAVRFTAPPPAGGRGGCAVTSGLITIPQRCQG